MKTTTTQQPNHGWLDKLAVSMAAICAVHCLLMPILIVALPIIATSLFVHEDFHIWMLLFVLPSTGISIFMGCRKHKDKWTAALSIIGLLVLTAVTVAEQQHHKAISEHNHACEQCTRSTHETIPAYAWINALGGVFLVAAHGRNFRLCRKDHCNH